MKIQPVSLNLNPKKLENLKQVSVNKPVPANIDVVKGQISNIFYYPVSFSSSKRTYGSEKSGFKEKSGDFKVSYYNNITCPACGKKMFNRSKMKHIYSEMSELQPEQYLDYLGQYKDYMRPVEASVYEEIYALSQKPGASKDIRTLVVSLRDEKLPVLQNAQMHQIKKMRSLARTLPSDEKAVLLKKLDGLQKIVRKNKSDSPFRRKIMIDRISKIKIRNPKKYQKLLLYANAFPTSKDMNSAWIVKYSGKNKQNEDWSSKDIAMRFLSQSLANTDHILAYSIEDNHDDITNYMSMHCGCNSEKGNKPFVQWLHEDKENRIKYMQQYFSDVDTLISSKKLNKKKYRNYVAYATKTVEEASRGQVKVEQLMPAMQ